MDTIAGMLIQVVWTNRFLVCIVAMDRISSLCNRLTGTPFIEMKYVLFYFQFSLLRVHLGVLYLSY